MTESQNPVSVIDHDNLPQSAVVTTQFTVNEGDLLFWDGSNFSARPLVEKTDVAPAGTHNSTGFMGVALGANKPEVYGGDAALPQVPVGCRMCIFVNSTAGDTYRHFDLVTIGADAQTVTKVGATEANAVGAVIIDPPASARPEQATPVSESVEGGVGVRIRITLLPKHIVAKNV
jgi:hypothetical protein